MLFYNFNSTSPRRVRIYLAEKGIEVPMVNVDLGTGGHRAPEYVAKNIFHAVPMLELDDGTCISESMAICRYFEAAHPEPPLYGRTSKEQAIVEMWVRRVELNVLQAAGQVWVHDSPVTAGAGLKRIPEVAAGARKSLARIYKILDGHFADNEFLAGDYYSVADASSLAIVDFASKRVAVPYAEDLVHLKRWNDQMNARPSANAGLPQNVEPF